MINHALRAARTTKRWSMQVASERVGVDRVTYSRWERGEQTPHLTTLDLLCRAFEMSPEALGFAHLIGNPAQLEPKALDRTPPVSATRPPEQQGSIIPFPLGRLPRRRSFQEVYA